MAQPGGHLGAHTSWADAEQDPGMGGSQGFARKKAVGALFNQGEAQLGEADAEAMQEERAEAPAAADAE